MILKPTQTKGKRTKQKQIHTLPRNITSAPSKSSRTSSTSGRNYKVDLPKVEAKDIKPRVLKTNVYNQTVQILTGNVVTLPSLLKAAENYKHLVLEEVRIAKLELNSLAMSDVVLDPCDDNGVLCVDKKVFRTGSRKQHCHFSIDIPGIAENRPSVLADDTVVIEPMGTNLGHRGRVKSVSSTRAHVVFNMTKNIAMELMQRSSIRVHFEMNTYTYRAMLCALSRKDFATIMTAIAPTSVPRMVLGGTDVIPDHMFFNENISNNETQSLAVRYIATKLQPGPPFLLFGPSGKCFKFTSCTVLTSTDPS